MTPPFFRARHAGVANRPPAFLPQLFVSPVGRRLAPTCVPAILNGQT